MVAGLLLFLMCIVAFIVGLCIWKWCDLGGSENKFNHEHYKQIMDAKLAKEQLETEMSLSIKKANRATRKALEEDLGTVEFTRLMRSI